MGPFPSDNPWGSSMLVILLLGSVGVGGWLIVDLARHVRDPWRCVAAALAGSFVAGALLLVMFGVTVEGNVQCGYSPATAAFRQGEYASFIGTDFDDSLNQTCIRDHRLVSWGSLGLVALAGLIYGAVSRSTRTGRRSAAVVLGCGAAVAGVGGYHALTREPAAGHYRIATAPMVRAISDYRAAAAAVLAPTQTTTASASVQHLARADYSPWLAGAAPAPRATVSMNSTPRIVRSEPDGRVVAYVDLCATVYGTTGKESSNGCDDWLLTLADTAGRWQVSSSKNVSPA